MNLFANTIIDLSSLVIVILLFAGGRSNREQDFSQKLFNGMLLCLACYFVSDLLGWFLNGKALEGGYIMLLVLNSLIYCTQIVCTFLWLLYTDYWIFRSEARIKKRIYVYAIPLFIEIMLLVANAFTGWIFRIDSAHLYVRGPFYLHSMLVFHLYAACSMYLSLHAFFCAKDRERKTYCLWMAGFLVLPYFASLVSSLFFYGITVAAPFYALSLLMVYLNVHQKRLIEEKQKVAQRDAALQKANVAIMLSQIQPHFLYNSLTTIYGLCESDPARAQEAVGMFSSYLRFNMESLKQERPVPFATELTHTKTYLTLEKMRFDEQLQIVWDIETDAFLIPTLTVQPLVENAVKHGLGKSLHGGTVTIKTREYDDCFTVTVQDDGVGFDPEAPAEDGRTHIGIANVRARLMTMRHATLRIQSSPGHGAVAIITVPKARLT